MYTAVNIKKSYSTRMECFVKYYGIICLLNNIQVSATALSILAYTSMIGGIKNLQDKKKFCKGLGIKLHSYNNLVYSLLEKGLLVKEGKEVNVNKQLHIDCPFLLQIKIENEAD